MPMEYGQRYDLAGEVSDGILGTAKNFAVATLADLGMTLWNSIPFHEDARTEDLLASIDSSALNFFNQNPDTVRLASFVGGIFIPGGVSMKLLGRARAGASATGYIEGAGLLEGTKATFLGTRQKYLEQEIADIYKESGKASSTYKSLRNQLIASNIGKELADNAIMEVAIIAAMNGHPYMEDYAKDPLYNFTVGVLAGGAIGTVFAVPQSLKAIREVVAPIQSESYAKILSSMPEGEKVGYRAILGKDQSMTESALVQRLSSNIANLDHIILDANTNNLTRTLAKDLKISDSAQRMEAMYRAAEWLRPVKNETEEISKFKEIMSEQVMTMMRDPANFGIDKIKFFDLNTISHKTPKGVVFKEELHKEGITQLMDPKFITPEGKPAMAFMRLGTKEVFEAEGARNAALAVDIKGIQAHIKSVASKESKGVLTAPRNDFSLEVSERLKSAAAHNAEFLEELAKLDKISVADLPYLQVAPDHLPRMNAIVAKLSKLSPEDALKFKIKVRGDWAVFDDVRKAVESGGLGVKPTYFKDIKNLIRTGNVDYASIGVSEETSKAITKWIHKDIEGGGINKANLRFAFDYKFRGTALPEHLWGAKTNYVHIADEMWEKGAKFREELRKHADADGNVYLYRGTRTAPTGASAVESFTPNPDVAEGFGMHMNLYQVPVDNIIGTFGAGGIGEMEILVGSRHHAIVNNIPIMTGDNTIVQIPTGARAKDTYTAEEFLRMHADETTRQAKLLMDKGHMSFEEVSSRLGITVDAARAVYAGSDLYGLGSWGTPWRMYDDAAKIESHYLDPKNKLYMVEGNPHKNPMSEALANADARSAAIIQKDQFEVMTKASGSKIGNDLMDFFTSEGMVIALESLQSKISELHNASVGNVLFQSADQALRNLSTGSIVTYIGKSLINKIDAAVPALLKDVAASYTALGARPSALMEFNQAVQQFYGLQGWRQLRIDDMTGFGIIVQKEGTGKNMREVPILNKDGSTYFIKQGEVLASLQEMIKPGDEIMKIQNLVRQMTGRAPMESMGFWIPPIDLTGKSRAIVIYKNGKEFTSQIVANNASELTAQMDAFQKLHADEIRRGEIEIIPQGQLKDYNTAEAYLAAENNVTYADNAKFHTGTSRQAITAADSRFIENIMQGYKTSIINGYRRYTEMYMSDTFGWLDKISDFNQRGAKDQPKFGLGKEKLTDAAMSAKNILLGRDQLEQFPGWKAVNSLYEFAMNRVASGFNSVVATFKPEQQGSREFFDSLNAQYKMHGITPAFQSFDEFRAINFRSTSNISPQIQSAGNGLLATLNLRMLDTAQAAVNLMSLPILTWSALMEKIPGTIVNAQGSMVQLPAEVAMTGMRAMFDPARRANQLRWEKNGHVKQSVRQYTDMTSDVKGLTGGIEATDKVVAKLNAFQNSDLVKWMSKPADMVEELTRSYAMHTGWEAAKKAYPGITDVGADIAAVAFADRIIGNYHAAQRPGIFQGTFGSAIGLYQTYMLTFAQSVYRGIENKNFRQLASLALAQGGIFGISSYPGYHLLSENIIGHMSDQHVDLTTGTYRAVEDHAARMILYGLPSSIGPGGYGAAFYTRGELNPRFPSTMENIAMFNGIKQGFSALYQIAAKTSEGIANGQATQSLMEAISLQSMNRPIARWAELVSGASISQQYNTVSPAAEVYSFMGIAARVLGTRPMEEQVTRNAVYMNRYYEALDHDRRENAVNKLSTAVRKNNDDIDDVISKTAEEYLRYGGSAKGWRSVLNKTLLTSEEGAGPTLMRKMESDNPLHKMIADLY